MASRYWVGGSGTWDGVSTTHWSASSGGGTGGASVPGSADAAIFDAASGGGVVTITTPAAVASVNASGFTGSFTGSGNLSISGNLNIGAGMTASGWTGLVTVSGNCTLTTNGLQLGISLAVDPTGAVTLNSALNTTGAISSTAGAGSKSFDTTVSNFAVTAASLNFAATNATLTLNGSTVTLTGTGAVFAGGTGAGAVSASNATINLTGGSGTFAGGNKTYGTVNFTAAATGTWTITGGNTFGTLNVPAPAGARTLQFTAGTTTTITTAFTATGYDSLNRFTLQSATAATHTLSKSSGSVSLDYASISYSIASGGATFTASSSVDGGNNTGWVFTVGGDTLFFGTPF